MRTKEIIIAGRTIHVKERKIKELKELVANVMDDVDKVTEKNNDDSFAGMANQVVSVMQEKICVIFPEISPCEVEDSYPSEIEELVQAFVDVNFFGIKKAAMSVLKLAQMNS